MCYVDQSMQKKVCHPKIKISIFLLPVPTPLKKMKRLLCKKCLPVNIHNRALLDVSYSLKNRFNLLEASSYNKYDSVVGVAEIGCVGEVYLVILGLSKFLG